VGSTSYISPFLIFLSLCILLSLPIYFCFSVFPYPIVIQTSCLFFILSLLWLYHSVITILLYLVLLDFTVFLWVSVLFCVSLSVFNSCCLSFALSSHCPLRILFFYPLCLLSLVWCPLLCLICHFGRPIIPTAFSLCSFIVLFLSFYLIWLYAFFLYVFYNCFVNSYFHLSVFSYFHIFGFILFESFSSEFPSFSIINFFFLCFKFEYLVINLLAQK